MGDFVELVEYITNGLNDGERSCSLTMEEPCCCWIA